MKPTRQTALLEFFLAGGALSIKNAFINFGISNPAREVARLVENKVGIELIRTKKVAKTKFGTSTYYFEYKASASNKLKIKEYLKKLRHASRSKD